MKYRNRPTVIDGHRFPSQKEALRYLFLRSEERAGRIRSLELQVPFVLAPPVVLNGKKKPALRYVADFVYEEFRKITVGDLLPKGTIVLSPCEAWVPVINDVKGFVTDMYRAKKHLMKSVHGVEILET